MRFEGILKSWNDERGFGFVQSAQGGEEVFVHATAFAARHGRPKVGERISFEIELGPRGKKRAKNVTVARARRPARPTRAASPAAWGTATLLVIPAFLVVYVTATLLWRLPAWVGLAYVVLSIATFGAYASDKTAAGRGMRRTPESTLHLLALAGGWPGALLAQQLLRHKSVKAEFRSVFWVTVVLNVVGLVVVSSPTGRSWLALP